MTDEEKDEQFYRDTESAAFAKIDDAQLAMLEPLGHRLTLARGDIVYRAGQRDLGMIVVLSGELEVFESRDGQEQILATPQPRDFVGELSMLTGTAALATVRGKAEQSELLNIPVAHLHKALAGLPGLSEMLVEAFMLRRKRLQRDREFAGFRVLAPGNSPDGHLIHDFLDKNHIPHRLIESTTEYGRSLADRLKLAPRDLPALITPDGKPLRRPSLREVARAAGLLRSLSEEGDHADICCDLVIVGAGPAGLAAAVNAASEGLKTVVLESYAPGGQASSSSLIENFFGFPTGISGGDLTYRAQLQAFRFGAKMSTPAHAYSLSFADGDYPQILQVEGCDASLRAKCVIIATGAEYNRLDAARRDEFENAGVYYAATAMESQLCKHKTAVVVGAGNSAGQAAMFLCEVADKVVLIVRGETLAKSMSSYLSNRVETQDNIEVLYRTEIRSMSGGRRLESIEIENTATGERRTIETPAVFSMIGAKPCTRWLPPEIACDERGFILTGAAVADAPAWTTAGRLPRAMETSRPGIFAAGDVRSGSVKRCSAAVGEGSVAVENVHSLLGTYA